MRACRFGARWVAPGPLLLALAGCDLAPAYHTPLVAAPVSYAEAAPWQPAAPADAAPRGAWWTIYGDPTLNQLEARVETQNPDLAAARARYDEARALVAEARSGLFPQLSFGAQISSNRQSDRRPLRGANEPNQYMANSIDTQASYELDIWDRVANNVAAAKAAAAATAADAAALRLSLQAELASDFFTLRGLDAQARLYAHTVATYRAALTLTQNRFAGKIASGMDVSRAANQLDTAAAQASEIAARRALVAHGIAVLAGVPPAALPIAPTEFIVRVPAILANLPATLLQRRPDIASAERLVASANAQIGVARAAFYPNISLNAILGLQDTGLNLFNMPDSFWSVGPGLAMPLFEGGLRTAETNVARDEYRAAVAQYRSTVLNAFADVEDQLALQHWLATESARANAAVGDARQTLAMAMTLYRDGATNFLDVATAQTAELDAERVALDIRTRQLLASVGLIRALGGGWTDSTAVAASL